jgi:hypothetical protein
MRALTLIGSAIALLALLVFIYRFRARPIVEAQVPGEDWRPTEEVVDDPATGRTLRIWVDPADGSRHSVAELR